MQQLLPPTCTVLASALIIGPPLPPPSSGKSKSQVAGAGVASLAFQRRHDFMMFSPELHVMYTEDIDAHHASMQSSAADSNSEFALLCIYVDPAAAAEAGSAACAAVGVLQVLLQVAGSGEPCNRMYALGSSDDAAAQLPVAINRNQLFCIRSAAVCVVSHVIACCLSLSSPAPDSDESLQAFAEERTFQGHEQQQQTLSLIALAENDFESNTRAAHAPSKPAVSSAPNGKLSAQKKTKASLGQHNAHSATAEEQASRQPNALRMKAESDSRSSSPKAYSPTAFSPDMSLRSQIKRQSPLSSPPNHTQPAASFAQDPQHATPSQRHKILRPIAMQSEAHEEFGSYSSLYAQGSKSMSRRAQNKSFLIPTPALEDD